MVKINYRFYSKNKLVSWMQRRCIVCGRYINKVEQKFCKFCCKKAYERHESRLRSLFRHYTLESIRESMHITIPQFIRIILWRYC